LVDFVEKHFEADQIANIKKTITYLNRFQFFHFDSHVNHAVQRTLTNPKTRTFVAQAFSLMGYRFIVQESLGYYGIVPTDEINDGRLLTDMETFVVLGLKLVYDKCFDRGDIDEKANVETTINDFCDELSSFAREADWEIDNVKIRDALRRLRGNQIVSFDDKLNDEDDIPIKIRPFIRDVVSVDALNRIELFLLKKTGKPGEAEIVDTDDVVEPEDAQDEAEIELKD